MKKESHEEGDRLRKRRYEELGEAKKKAGRWIKGKSKIKSTTEKKTVRVRERKKRRKKRERERARERERQTEREIHTETLRVRES